MTDLDKKSHDEAIRAALISLDVNPKYVMRRYVEAVIEEEDFNINAAAKRLGCHDFVLRRIVARPRPPVFLK